MTLELHVKQYFCYMLQPFYIFAAQFEGTSATMALAQVRDITGPWTQALSECLRVP